MKPGTYTEETTGQLVEIHADGRVVVLPTEVKPMDKWELTRPVSRCGWPEGLVRLQEASTGKRLASFRGGDPQMEYIARWLVQNHNLVDTTPLEAEGLEEWLKGQGFERRGLFNQWWCCIDPEDSVVVVVWEAGGVNVYLLELDRDQEVRLQWIKTRGQLLMLIAQMKGLT